MRDVINWFKDGNSLLVKMVSSSRKDLIDTKAMVPSGPTISVNEGKKAQNRTYQDLLKNKNDEYRRNLKQKKARIFLIEKILEKIIINY